MGATFKSLEETISKIKENFISWKQLWIEWIVQPAIPVFQILLSSLPNQYNLKLHRRIKTHNCTKIGVWEKKNRKDVWFSLGEQMKWCIVPRWSFYLSLILQGVTDISISILYNISHNRHNQLWLIYDKNDVGITINLK